MFANDKLTLHRWRDDVIVFLQTLRLTIHENRAQPRPVGQGIPFLGFIVYPDHRRLKHTTGFRYRRHLTALYGQYRAGLIGRAALDASVRAWVGHAMHGDTWGLRRQLFEKIVL